MLYCTSTVAFGATSLKGGLELFSPLGEYGFSREGFAFVLLTLLQVLSLFQMLYCTSTVAFGATLFLTEMLKRRI